MRLKVLFFFLILAGSLRADNFLLSTENTSMLLTATVGDSQCINIMVRVYLKMKSRIYLILG